MEEPSKNIGDVLVWSLLVLTLVSILVMVWMGIRNPVQAPSTTSVETEVTPTITTTVTPTQIVTPASDKNIDLKLKEVNNGASDVDASLEDKAINIE